MKLITSIIFLSALAINLDCIAMQDSQTRQGEVFICSSCGAHQHKKDQKIRSTHLSSRQKLQAFNNIFEELLYLAEQILSQVSGNNDIDKQPEQEDFLSLVNRLPENDKTVLLKLFDARYNTPRAYNSAFIDIGIEKLKKAIDYLKQRHQELLLDTQT